VLLASTHVPWFMDGALAAPLRGGLAIDGNFWHTLRGSTWGLVPEGGSSRGGGALLIEPSHDAALMERWVVGVHGVEWDMEIWGPGWVFYWCRESAAWQAGCCA
jgi:hypothetical protein